MDKNIPKRRFKEFIDSGAWEEKKLGEMNFTISDGNYGELYPKSYEILTEGIPFIRVNNIKNGYLTKDSLVYISSKLHTILTSGHLEKNDILITTRGEIGKIAIVDKHFINANINAQICLIRTGINMNSKYLHQYLQTDSSYKEIISLQTGSALKQLPRKRISDIELRFPSLAEQEKIGDFFQRLDKLIDINREKLEKLKTSKSAYLEEMFPREGEDRPRRRFQGFTGPWQEEKLGEVAIIKGRLGWKSLKKEEYIQSGPSMIAGKHIRNGIIDWDNVDHIPEWRYYESPEIMLKNGDVIFSKDGTLGNPALISDLKVLATINSTMMLVRTNETINSLFFYYVLLTERFVSLIKMKVSGSSVPHLFQADMNEFTFSIPSLGEQKKIGNFFKKLDEQIELQERKIEKLENMKKSYLAEMFV